MDGLLQPQPQDQYDPAAPQVSASASPVCPVGDGYQWEIHPLTCGRARIVLTDGYNLDDNF